MSEKWLRRCLAAYLTAMAACGGAWAGEPVNHRTTGDASIDLNTGVGINIDPPSVANGDNITICGDGRLYLGNPPGVTDSKVNSLNSITTDNDGRGTLLLKNTMNIEIVSSIGSAGKSLALLQVGDTADHNGTTTVHGDVHVKNFYSQGDAGFVVGNMHVSGTVDCSCLNSYSRINVLNTGNDVTVIGTDDRSQAMPVATLNIKTGTATLKKKFNINEANVESGMTFDGSFDDSKSTINAINLLAAGATLTGKADADLTVAQVNLAADANINGATAAGKKLTITALDLGSHAATISGYVAAPDFSANTGTLNIRNGSFTAKLASGSYGKVNITLGDANKVSSGKAALITTGGAIAASDITGNFTIDGGKPGNTYAVIDDGDAKDAAVKNAIESVYSSLYRYNALTHADNAAIADGVYAVKIYAQTAEDVAKDATISGKDNGSMGGALAKMAEDDALPAGVKVALEKLNGAEFGKAVDAMNGNKAVSSSATIAKESSAMFGSAIGGAFAEGHAAGIAADVLGGGVAAAGRESASAGGAPVTYADCGKTADGGVYTGWFKVYGGFGGVDNSAASAGYGFGGVGTIVGIDRKFGRELTLGALIGYNFNKADLNRNLGEATDHVLRTGLYGNYGWNGFFFDTTPTFGIHMLKNERKILGLATAKSDRAGFDFNFYNQVGYTYSTCDGWMFTPSYALGMTYLHEPGYTEHGAGDFNLRVRDSDQWSLLQTLQMKLGKVIPVNDKFTLLPEIWGGWEHEYLDSNDVSMGFAAAANRYDWAAPVHQISKDRAVFGAGVRTLWNGRYEAYARYDQKLWDGGFNTNFTVGFGVKF